MKVFNVIVLVVFSFLNSLNAQDTIKYKKIYRTWVYLNKEPFEIKGVLYDINDSSLFVSSSLVRKEYSTNSFEIEELNFNNIQTIKTRRNNNIGRGVLIGSVAGFVIGGVSGLIAGDDPPCDSWICLFNMTAEEKAMFSGTLLAVFGAGIGAIAGSIKITIPINGSINTFDENNSRLKSYSYKSKNYE